MTDRSPLPLEALQQHAQQAALRSHVPYSGREEGAVLLLSDGTWVPGVRVESATFSLLIPALLGALTIATASGRRDVVAAVQTRTMREDEALIIHQGLPVSFRRAAEGLALVTTSELPAVGNQLDPRLDDALTEMEEAGITLARRIAKRAHVPDSDFPVGCVLQTTSGDLLPGVNVEHPDWSRILCAERTAISMAITYGLIPERLYLTCLKDETGSPCGACRQILVEHAPTLPIHMDRGAAPAEHTIASDLLPGAFRGDTLTAPSA